MATDQTTGRVLTTTPALAVAPFSYSGAIMFDALGRIVVSTSEPIRDYANGLPFGASGALCVSTVAP